MTGPCSGSMEFSWEFSRIINQQNPAMAFVNGIANVNAAGTAQSSRIVKFSPDGLCALSCDDDCTASLFEVPFSAVRHQTLQLPWQPVLKCDAGERINDLAWHPLMNSQTREGCYFASTARDHPIHLWDAFTGAASDSYRAYDAMDELTSALSVAFTPCGTQLLGGYTGSIRIFDVSRPGRENMQRDSPSPRGTVSALACSPDHSGVYAAGTFDGCFSCYSLHARETLVSLKHPSSTAQSGSAPKRRRHIASVGVTQLQFSPCARYLYSGARRDPFVICWDIRNTSQALCRFRRQCDNNQRIGFDIDSSGRYLCLASQSGRVAFFDLQHVGGGATDDADVPEIQAAFEIDTQRESGSSTENVVNGVALHPFAPLLLLSRGARDFSSAPARSARAASAAVEDASSDPSTSDDESSSRVPPTGSSRIGFRAISLPSDDDVADQMPSIRFADRGTCEMWRLQPADQQAWSTYLDAFP